LLFALSEIRTGVLGLHQNSKMLFQALIVLHRRS